MVTCSGEHYHKFECLQYAYNNGYTTIDHAPQTMSSCSPDHVTTSHTQSSILHTCTHSRAITSLPLSSLCWDVDWVVGVPSAWMCFKCTALQLAPSQCTIMQSLPSRAPNAQCSSTQTSHIALNNRKGSFYSTISMVIHTASNSCGGGFGRIEALSRRTLLLPCTPYTPRITILFHHCLLRNYIQQFRKLAETWLDWVWCSLGTRLSASEGLVPRLGVVML